MTDKKSEAERVLKDDQVLEAYYGLPKKVEFCIRCNMSNQQPMSTNEYKHGKDSVKTTIHFTDGLCDACLFHEKKDKETDWDERQRELVDLCDQYRKTDGRYDCIIGGSGGKDSAMQAHLLKYKYKMNPLTVTWSPHLYTDIGWKNFQNWIHEGGFDNFLFTPNGRVHRKLTRNATLNLLHPFQPFILGQKTFVVKMAARLNIPLVFYGEAPGQYGEKIDINQSGFSFKDNLSDGYQLDYSLDGEFRHLKLGGIELDQYLDEGFSLSDLSCYLPESPGRIYDANIEFKFLGYYLNWVPQEAFYYAVENTGFSANPERTEGTYSKYNSLDDKIDGFFYYTRWIKFGVGRAMMDSAQEVRNGHLSTEEGRLLINKYDGEFPKKYESDFLQYVDMSREEFDDLCDSFRSPHLWHKINNEWKLRVSL